MPNTALVNSKQKPKKNQVVLARHPSDGKFYFAAVVDTVEEGKEGQGSGSLFNFFGSSSQQQQQQLYKIQFKDGSMHTVKPEDIRMINPKFSAPSDDVEDDRTGYFRMGGQNSTLKGVSSEFLVLNVEVLDLSTTGKYELKFSKANDDSDNEEEKGMIKLPHIFAEVRNGKRDRTSFKCHIPWSFLLSNTAEDMGGVDAPTNVFDLEIILRSGSDVEGGEEEHNAEPEIICTSKATLEQLLMAGGVSLYTINKNLHPVHKALRMLVSSWQGLPDVRVFEKHRLRFTYNPPIDVLDSSFPLFEADGASPPSYGPSIQNQGISTEVLSLDSTHILTNVHEIIKAEVVSSIGQTRVKRDVTEEVQHQLRSSANGSLQVEYTADNDVEFHVTFYPALHGKQISFEMTFNALQMLAKPLLTLRRRDRRKDDDDDDNDNNGGYVPWCRGHIRPLYRHQMDFAYFCEPHHALVNVEEVDRSFDSAPSWIIISHVIIEYHKMFKSNMIVPHFAHFLTATDLFTLKLKQTSFIESGGAEMACNVSGNTLISACLKILQPKLVSVKGGGLGAATTISKHQIQTPLMLLARDVLKALLFFKRISRCGGGEGEEKEEEEEEEGKEEQSGGSNECYDDDPAFSSSSPRLRRTPKSSSSSPSSPSSSYIVANALYMFPVVSRSANLSIYESNKDDAKRKQAAAAILNSSKQGGGGGSQHVTLKYVRQLTRSERLRIRNIERGMREHKNAYSHVLTKNLSLTLKDKVSIPKGFLLTDEFLGLEAYPPISEKQWLCHEWLYLTHNTTKTVADGVFSQSVRQALGRHLSVHVWRKKGIKGPDLMEMYGLTTTTKKGGGGQALPPVTTLFDYSARFSKEALRRACWSDSVLGEVKLPEGTKQRKYTRALTNGEKDRIISTRLFAAAGQSSSSSSNTVAVMQVIHPKGVIVYSTKKKSARKRLDMYHHKDMIHVIGPPNGRWLQCSKGWVQETSRDKSTRYLRNVTLSDQQRRSVLRRTHYTHIVHSRIKIKIMVGNSQTVSCVVPEGLLLNDDIYRAACYLQEKEWVLHYFGYCMHHLDKDIIDSLLQPPLDETEEENEKSEIFLRNFMTMEHWWKMARIGVEFGSSYGIELTENNRVQYDNPKPTSATSKAAKFTKRNDDLKARVSSDGKGMMIRMESRSRFSDDDQDDDDKEWRAQPNDNADVDDDENKVLRSGEYDSNYIVKGGPRIGGGKKKNRSKKQADGGGEIVTTDATIIIRRSSYIREIRALTERERSEILKQTKEDPISSSSTHVVMAPTTIHYEPTKGGDGGSTRSGDDNSNTAPSYTATLRKGLLLDERKRDKIKALLPRNTPEDDITKAWLVHEYGYLTHDGKKVHYDAMVPDDLVEQFEEWMADDLWDLKGDVGLAADYGIDAARADKFVTFSKGQKVVIVSGSQKNKRFIGESGCIARVATRGKIKMAVVELRAEDDDGGATGAALKAKFPFSALQDSSYDGEKAENDDVGNGGANRAGGGEGVERNGDEKERDALPEEENSSNNGSSSKVLIPKKRENNKVPSTTTIMKRYDIPEEVVDGALRRKDKLYFDADEHKISCFCALFNCNASKIAAGTSAGCLLTWSSSRNSNKGGGGGGEERRRRKKDGSSSSQEEDGEEDDNPSVLAIHPSGESVGVSAMAQMGGDQPVLAIGFQDGLISTINIKDKVFTQLKSFRPFTQPVSHLAPSFMGKCRVVCSSRSILSVHKKSTGKELVKHSVTAGLDSEEDIITDIKMVAKDLVAVATRNGSILVIRMDEKSTNTELHHHQIIGVPIRAMVVDHNHGEAAAAAAAAAASKGSHHFIPKKLTSTCHIHAVCKAEVKEVPSAKSIIVTTPIKPQTKTREMYARSARIKSSDYKLLGMSPSYLRKMILVGDKVYCIADDGILIWKVGPPNYEESYQQRKLFGCDGDELLDIAYNGGKLYTLSKNSISVWDDPIS